MGLSDNYYRTANAPAQQTAAQMQQTAQQMPQLGAQVEDYRRQNAPMSPWEEAAMELQMEHTDPKMVAAKLKAKLQGGGGGQPMPNQSGMEGPPSMGPPPTAGEQGMPQGISQLQNSTPNGNVYRQPEEQGFAAQMPQTIGDTRMQQGGGRSGKMPFDTKGMNHRDYEDFMGKMGNISKQRSDRDWMALEQEKTRRATTVEGMRGDTAKEVANTKRDFAKEKLSSDEKRAELDRRVKEKKLDETTAHDVAQEHYWQDSLTAKIEHFKSTKDTNEKIKILHEIVSMSNNAANNSAKIASSLTGMAYLGNKDIMETSTKSKEEFEKMKTAAEETIKQLQAAHSQSTKTTEGDKTSMPAGYNKGAASKYTIGQIVDIGGGRKGKVTGFGANGKPNVEPIE